MAETEDNRNSEFEQRLLAVKLQREKAQLEKEATMSDAEKIAMAKQKKVAEDHAKKNPYRRPSLVDGQLGIFMSGGRAAPTAKAAGRGRGRGRGKKSIHVPKAKSVFNYDTIDAEKDTAAPTDEVSDPNVAAVGASVETLAVDDGDDDDEGVPPIGHGREESSAIVSVDSDHRSAETIKAADTNMESDTLDALKLDDQVDFETADNAEYLLLKAPVLQLRLRSTKSLSLGFRKYVWKKVCLVLREKSLELYKSDDESSTRHCKLDLDKINLVSCVDDMLNGFKVGTSSEVLELRAATKDEAVGWIKAIAHNQNVLHMEKTGTLPTNPDKHTEGETDDNQE